MFPVQCVNDVPGLYRGNHSPLEGESQKPSRQAKADAVAGGAEPKDCGPRPRQEPTGRDLSPAGGSLKMASDICKRRTDFAHAASRLRWKLRIIAQQLEGQLDYWKNLWHGTRVTTRMCPSCRALVGVKESVCSLCGAKLRRRPSGLGKLLTNILPQYTPVSYGLLTANFLVFLAMFAAEQKGTVTDFGRLVTGENHQVLVTWGADVALLVAQGEWWRLVSAIFIHIGIIHLLFNSYALMFIGPLLEELLGKERFLAAYLATGVIGFVLSNWYYPPRAGDRRSLGGRLWNDCHGSGSLPTLGILGPNIATTTGALDCLRLRLRDLHRSQQRRPLWGRVGRRRSGFRTAQPQSTARDIPRGSVVEGALLGQPGDHRPVSPPGHFESVCILARRLHSRPLPRTSGEI